MIQFSLFFWQDNCFSIISHQVALKHHYMCGLKHNCPHVLLQDSICKIAKILSSLPYCDMMIVQSSISLATVWKWTAHNRHYCSKHIYQYNMWHMIKLASFPHYNVKTALSDLSTWESVFEKATFLQNKNKSQCKQKSKMLRKMNFSNLFGLL